ncbi:MAG: cyclin family protein [Candidatus Odinarchaeota archaeon]
MSDKKEMEFDALNILNRVSRELDLSPELQDMSQKHISRYYSKAPGTPSLPPVIVASVLYYLSEQMGEPLSVRAVTNACGVSTRWFEKKREEILKKLF